MICFFSLRKEDFWNTNDLIKWMEDSEFNFSGISLVLPMYNERENIADTVSCINGILSQTGLDYEIIVCNDGSRDGSDWIARGLLKENNRIRLISSSRNMGYGYALRSGFAAAEKDIVMYTDSDLPCDITVLKDNLHLLNKLDVLIGFRNRRDNLLRELYSIVYNAIVRVVFHIRVKDINFSFKVFKREIINSLGLKSRGSFIDAEMMARAIKSGYRIQEISMQYYPRRRGKSTLSSPRAILFILYEMVKLYPEIMKKGRTGLLGNTKQKITVKNSQLVKFKRYARLSDNYWWFSGMRCILNGLMDCYRINRCGVAVRHLDLGCGSGASLNSEFTIGIDVSADALLVCRQHKNNRLLQAKAESLPFKEEAFDVITAEGVIEHIHSDNALLDEAFRVSKNSGYLLVLTSAYNFLWSHHDIASGHHRRYTRQKLKGIIEKAGFHILKITYINSFLLPLIATIRFLQKITGIDRSLDKEDLFSIPGPLNYILTGVLYLESLISRVYSFPAGVSLVCLAQKKP